MKGFILSKARKLHPSFTGILAIFLIAFALSACGKKGQDETTMDDSSSKGTQAAGEANGQELFEKGEAFYNARDYKEAAKYFSLAAEKGNEVAMTYLGACYAEGEGVEQDKEEAVKWYRKAAEKGDTDAMCFLGECFLVGFFGVEQDKEEAIKWYRKAAEKGDTFAEEKLKELTSQ
jgi:hypothetical protein